MKVACMALTLASALAASGCAGKSGDYQTTQAEGAGVGAVVGGILGAVIGGNAQSAAIGAAAGAGAGFLGGTAVAEQKEQYAANEDYYDEQIAAANDMNSQLNTQIGLLRNDITARNDRIAQLQTKERNGVDASADAHKELGTLSQRLKDTRNSYAAAQQELNEQNAAYQQALNAGQSGPKMTAWKDRLQTLTTTVAQLEGQLGQLTAQNQTLSAL